jgi:hypothetical protein
MSNWVGDGVVMVESGATGWVSAPKPTEEEAEGRYVVLAADGDAVDSSSSN